MSRKRTTDDCSSNNDIAPVLVIGAARSGTTLLGKHILAHHPSVVYWSEPNHIWNYRNLYSRSDVRGPEDASIAVKTYIRSEFRKYFETSGKDLLLEKTPANCLRLPFIQEVLPEAKFIHLIRDGRDVALSAATEWRGGKELVSEEASARLVDKFRDGLKVIGRQIVERDMLSTVRLRQLPYYAWRAFEAVRTRLLGTGILWGPRIPNLRKIARSHSLLETCAIQWRECVAFAMNAWDNIPEEQRIMLRYEDLLADPAGEVERLLDFMDLEFEERVEGRLRKVRSSNTEKWRESFNELEYRRVLRHIETTLQQLGYSV